MLYLQDSDFTLHQGDVLEVLREMPSESVDCVITSPPYWGLRDYGPEGQLGLEPTPEQYVERMVEVFGEVRRVLAAHGTCWVNMGDSYASSPPGNVEGVGATSGLHGVNNESGVYRETLKAGHATKRNTVVGGLKPKDLCGIPWRLAFALQQPYYAGRIKSEHDRVWLAAILDSEGCIHIHRRKAGADSGAKFTKKDGTEVSYARTQDTYGVMVSIDNTSKALVDRCEEIIGQGSRYVHEKATGKQQRKQTLYRLTLTGQQSRELLRELYPHLVAKQREARIAYHSPSTGEEAASCHEALKALHNGAETTVDRPSPPTLLEPGWYLRSDVIWGKPNPMPESVTDRPTKAHEYVFLLTKSPRYFFDQEAVREAHQEPERSGTPERRWSPGLDASEQTINGGYGRGKYTHRLYNPAGRNIRSVWEIATQPYPEAHFATFPEELVRRCLLAGTSERGGCPLCGAPWVRETTLGWRPSCDHRSCVLDNATLEPSPYTPIPATVLDPFMGSGTTALVARKHARHAVGIELNAEYCELIAKRTRQLSLLA